MKYEIGTTAGEIWNALNEKGEMSLAQLKKAVKGYDPVFHWALGWLAREAKIEITAAGKSYRVSLS